MDLEFLDIFSLGSGIRWYLDACEVYAAYG